MSRVGIRAAAKSIDEWTYRVGDFRRVAEEYATNSNHRRSNQRRNEMSRGRKPASARFFVEKQQEREP
jgi:hypothetical protein